MAEGTCSVDGCNKPVRTKGMCNACYEYNRKHGTTIRAGRVLIPLLERMWAYIDKDGPIPKHRPDLGPCWLWLGHPGPKGYGGFTLSHNLGTPIAHRAVWILLVGPIPDGLELDHLCLVKACVNPAHLEPVTGTENMRRAVLNRSVCRNGLHPLDASSAGQKLRCETCKEERFERFFAQYGGRAEYRRARRAAGYNA